MIESPFLVVGPVLASLATAIALVFASERARVRRAIDLTGAALLVGAAGALISATTARGAISLPFGDWALPFAIEFRADPLGSIFVLLASVAALAARMASVDHRRASGRGRGLTDVLSHGFTAGACGAFLTADLFNLYVWLEVALIAALGLVAASGRSRSLDAAFRYFVLNVIATAFLLVGVAGIYGITGHLNFSALTAAARTADVAALAPLVVVLTTALLVKAAAFPVFAWLPATYHTLATPQAALFAAIGTKLGIYAILRTHAGVFADLAPAGAGVLGGLAVATMIAGVLGAAYHWDLRRILAFHSVSQAGYMLLGVGLGTAAGAQGTVVFAVHHGLVKANLFLVAALICRATGSWDLRRAGGLLAARPWLAALFLSQALSLVGLPPSSGFWAKLILVRETLVEGQIVWTIAALGVGLLTLYSMLKIWVEAFWKPRRASAAAPPGATAAGRWLTASAAALAAVTLAIGVWPEPLVRVAARAAVALSGGGAQ